MQLLSLALLTLSLSASASRHQDTASTLQKRSLVMSQTLGFLFGNTGISPSVRRNKFGTVSPLERFRNRIQGQKYESHHAQRYHRHGHERMSRLGRASHSVRGVGGGEVQFQRGPRHYRVQFRGDRAMRNVRRVKCSSPLSRQARNNRQVRFQMGNMFQRSESEIRLAFQK
jgi:hypothetical protein